MTQRAPGSPIERPWGPFNWTLASFSVWCLVQGGVILAWRRGLATADLMVRVDDGGRALMASWAAWAMFILARRDHSGYGPTWRWMGLGLASLAGGTLFLVVAVDFLNIPPPWSLLRHAGYLAFLICLGRSLLVMPAARILPTGRIQALLDGIMISASLFFVAWGSFLHDLAARYWNPHTRYDLALVYSLGALILLSLWLTLEAQGPSIRYQGPAVLLRAGLALTVAWWTLFGVLSMPGVFRHAGVAELLDLIMLASLTCFALAALWPRSDYAPPPPTTTRVRVAVALSFLPAVTTMVYGSIVLLTGRPFDVVMVGAGVMLGLALCVRQYLALFDLENLSAQLEARVEARTRELREKQGALLEAQRHQMVASMAAGFAHDFKNALTVITNWCEMLADEAYSADWNQGVQAIRRASAKALGSVQKVLSAGRHQELHPQALDLPSALKELRKVLEGTLAGRADLLMDLPDHLGFQFDPAQLEDLLLNLVGNAGDAMTRKGTVTLRAFQDPMEPYAVLQVVDTGSGIPPEVLPGIFEPFTTTKATGHGTGLGLASVKGVLWQCGGSIDVESEVGQGTTFTLKLPQMSG